MKASLKSLATGGSVAGQTTPAEPSPPPAPEQTPRTYRTAQTRAETRQVSGHFRPDVAQTLRLIAAEQGRDIQEILAEALNMVFARYGKATRAEVSSGRRKKVKQRNLSRCLQIDESGSRHHSAHPQGSAHGGTLPKL